MSQKKHRKLEHVVWATRIDNKRPYQLVQCQDDDIKTSFFPGNGGDGVSVVVSRKDARLLANRINSCLDQTPRIRK